MKRFMIGTMILGTTLFAVVAAAGLGVLLGQRSIVVAADSMRQAIVLSVPTDTPPVQIAMGDRGATAR